MDQVSKNGITYNEVKTIFNDKIIKSATIIILEKPSNNRTNLLKLFFIWEKFLLKQFYSIKNEPLELEQEKEPKFGEQN